MGYEGCMGLETLDNWLALYLSVKHGMSSREALGKMGVAQEYDTQVAAPKMSLEEYHRVKQLHQGGMTYKAIAVEFGVCVDTLYYRCKRVRELMRVGYYRNEGIA